jgi:hypothetical protein
MLALLQLVVAQESTADEGRDIIIVMLIVGLIFIGVIALGELTHHLRRRH